MTVSNLIESIEGSPRQVRRSLPVPRNHVSADIQQDAVSGNQSKSEEVLEKDWAGGRTVKRNRMVVTPFDITKLKIAPSTARPGETITIGFEATNNSDFYSIYPVTVKINEQVVAAEVISVPPGFTLPMRASVIGAQPGDYQVEVNFTTGKFTVIGYDTSDDVTLKDFDMTKLDAAFDQGITEVAASLQQNRSSGLMKASRSAKSRNIIDTIADYIEIGLDKLGDALVFPIRKIVELFSSRRLK